jgi:transcriptional antiterminator NusG
MPESESSYVIGEVVRIKSGRFAGFVGKVKKVNKEKSYLVVIATIFGRTTSIALNLSNIEKVEFTKN